MSGTTLYNSYTCQSVRAAKTKQHRLSVQKAGIYFLVLLEAEILRLGSSIIKFYYRLFSWFADSLLLTVCSWNGEGESEKMKK